MNDFTPRQVVGRLFDACNAKDIETALSTFADAAVYHNVPLVPVTGVAAIRNVLAPFLDMASEVDWVVHHWAEAPGGIVMTERTDRFLIDGQWLELPVMGVFEVSQGRIQAWRDYFDMQLLAPLMAG